jgi:hypothetical protein
MDTRDRTTLKLEMHLFGERDKIVQTLREITDEAMRTFEEAAGPGGSPEMFRLGYATLLDRFLTLKREQRGFCDPMDSLYRRLAAWPAQLSADARSVRGDTHDLVLSAEALA